MNSLCDMSVFIQIASKNVCAMPKSIYNMNNFTYHVPYFITVICKLMCDNLFITCAKIALSFSLSSSVASSFYFFISRFLSGTGQFTFWFLVTVIIYWFFIDMTLACDPTFIKKVPFMNELNIDGTEFHIHGTEFHKSLLYFLCQKITQERAKIRFSWFLFYKSHCCKRQKMKKSMSNR